MCLRHAICHAMRDSICLQRRSVANARSCDTLYAQTRRGGTIRLCVILSGERCEAAFVVELLRVEGAKHRTSKSAKCEALSRIYERLAITSRGKCYFPFVGTTKFVTRSLRRYRSSAFARLASLPPNRFDYGCTHPSLRMTD